MILSNLNSEDEVRYTEIDTGVFINRDDVKGKGSYGKVYAGKYIRPEDKQPIKVAVKILEKVTLDIKNETELLSKLSHQFIVKYYTGGYSKKEKKYYIVTELCQSDLYTFFKKTADPSTKRLDEHTCALLFHDICMGIKHLHDNDIIHRDIKMQNILIDDKYNIRIIDFGTSKKLESDDLSTTTYTGTRAYMPYEVLLSASPVSYSKEFDIWSLGCLLFKLSTGEDYFPKALMQSADISSIECKERLKRYFDREVKYPPYLSKDIVEVMKGMLNVDGEKRLTIDEVIEHKFLSPCKPEEQLSIISSQLSLFKTSQQLIENSLEISDKALQSKLFRKISAFTIKKLKEQVQSKLSTYINLFHSIIFEEDPDHNNHHYSKDTTTLFLHIFEHARILILFYLKQLERIDVGNFSRNQQSYPNGVDEWVRSSHASYYMMCDEQSKQEIDDMRMEILAYPPSEEIMGKSIHAIKAEMQLLVNQLSRIKELPQTTITKYKNLSKLLTSDIRLAFTFKVTIRPDFLDVLIPKLTQGTPSWQLMKKLKILLNNYFEEGHFIELLARDNGSRNNSEKSEKSENFEGKSEGNCEENEVFRDIDEIGGLVSEQLLIMIIEFGEVENHKF